MAYTVIVNSTNEFTLFSWDTRYFREDPRLHLATSNLSSVKEAFDSIETLSILDNSKTEIAVFTEFNSFSSIAYITHENEQPAPEFNDELIVSLTRLNLAEQVNRLEKKVNPIVDTDSMTLEEFKEYKVNQISAAGEQIIFNGTDVTLSDNTTKNFTYNLEDQSNLLNAIFIIQTLGDLNISLPYHSHGEPCELYNAKDILAVYFTLQFFSTRIQTEINMKLNWIRACETKEEIDGITLETPLPTEWADRAQAIMGPAMELAAQLQAQYLGETE